MKKNRNWFTVALWASGAVLFAGLLLVILVWFCLDLNPDVILVPVVIGICMMIGGTMGIGLTLGSDNG